MAFAVQAEPGADGLRLPSEVGSIVAQIFAVESSAFLLPNKEQILILLLPTSLHKLMIRPWIVRTRFIILRLFEPGKFLTSHPASKRGRKGSKLHFCGELGQDETKSLFSSLFISAQSHCARAFSIPALHVLSPPQAAECLERAEF